MQHKAIATNDYHVPRMERRYKATMPGAETKTSSDYFWLLPDEIAFIVPYIREHPDTGFTSYRALTKALVPYYDR